MKTSTFVIILLSVALIGTVVFGGYYLTKVNPVEQLQNSIPVTAKASEPPSFKFSIYGDIKSRNLLNYPMDVTVDGGTIYVSDSDNGQIYTFDYNGKFKNVFGKGKLTSPYGIQVYNGQIYVADTAAGKIAVFDSKGKFIDYFKTTDREVIGPVGDLLINNDRLYVGVIQAMQVLVYDLNGNLIQKIGSEGTGKGQLKYPHGLALDEESNLYVADSGNNRIVVFDVNGQYVKTLGGNENELGKLTTVRGISFDSTGNLNCVCGLRSSIVVIDKQGKQLMEYGKHDKEELGLPNGIFLDSNGRVYVTETAASRVSVFQR